MLLLLAIVIAAPVVDAVACDDCRDIIPLWDMQQRLTKSAVHSDGNLLSSDGGRPAPKETGTAQDLCPVCANIAVAMGNVNFGAPTMISQTTHFQKLITSSDPPYSINKPPQN